MQHTDAEQKQLAAIASALGVRLANLQQSWPLIQARMISNGFTKDDDFIAALATIRVECPTFLPQTELGNRDYWIKHYWLNEKVRGWLGNICEEDAVTYRGRGFIQLTGRGAYIEYGTALSLNLVGCPDLALDIANAASIFAEFWRRKHVNIAAEAENWVKVRRIVNGGSSGLADFERYIKALQTKALQQAA